MTDTEIIKAKEHFEYGINCDIFSEPVLSYAKTALWAFEEINRQQAEIERLERYKKEHRFCNLIGNCHVYSKNLEDYNAMRIGLKSAGIKKFAQRLKEKFEGLAICTTNSITDKIDNLVKEMVGEE